ncbi:kinase-like protein [Gonapodya prolifera JEL478]|uniref:Kinase-like protein n=1 Tax=Gonapodya prolifera (strain JEL478) TaxID=1344416 RepID=A0A139AKP1_GONPJ|nr:kinase-like protein [Gonapodya prolifera JEL478]|eukprot:KXS17336.1 kinase-like protein [Gonapodya prolifera JEL478]
MAKVPMALLRPSQAALPVLPPTPLRIAVATATSVMLGEDEHLRQRRTVIFSRQLDKHVDPSSGRKCINGYSIVQEVGRGVNGKVKVGIDLRTGSQVAIKVVPRSPAKKSVNPRMRMLAHLMGDSRETGTFRLEDLLHQARIKREVEVLAMAADAGGDRIIGLREVVDDPSSPKVYIVLDYAAQGALKWSDDLADPPRPFWSEKTARPLWRDLLEGVAFLHYFGIAHRDIKPANLLIGQDNRLVLSDLGSSCYLRHAPAVSSTRPRTTVVVYQTTQTSDIDSATTATLDLDDELAHGAGTPAFLPPEACYGLDSDGRVSIETVRASASLTRSRPGMVAGDVWASGVTLYCIAFGKLPFAGANIWDAYRAVGIQAPSFNHGPDVLPPTPQLVHLLSRLLEKDQSRRATLKEAAFHEWTVADLDEIGVREWEARIGRWFVDPSVRMRQWEEKEPEPTSIGSRLRNFFGLTPKSAKKGKAGPADKLSKPPTPISPPRERSGMVKALSAVGSKLKSDTDISIPDSGPPQAPQERPPQKSLSAFFRRSMKIDDAAAAAVMEQINGGGNHGAAPSSTKLKSAQESPSRSKILGESPSRSRKLGSATSGDVVDSNRNVGVPPDLPNTSSTPPPRFNRQKSSWRNSFLGAIVADQRTPIPSDHSRTPLVDASVSSSQSTMRAIVPPSISAPPKGFRKYLWRPKSLANLRHAEIDVSGPPSEVSPRNSQTMIVRSSTAPNDAGLPPPSAVAVASLGEAQSRMTYSDLSGRQAPAGPNVRGQSPISQYSELSGQMRQSSHSKTSGDRPKSTPWHWTHGRPSSVDDDDNFEEWAERMTRNEEELLDENVPDVSNLRRHASLTAEVFQQLTGERMQDYNDALDGGRSPNAHPDHDDLVSREQRRRTAWEDESRGYYRSY